VGRCRNSAIAQFSSHIVRCDLCRHGPSLQKGIRTSVCCLSSCFKKALVRLSSILFSTISNTTMPSSSQVVPSLQSAHDSTKTVVAAEHLRVKQLWLYRSQVSSKLPERMLFDHSMYDPYYLLHIAPATSMFLLACRCRMLLSVQIAQLSTRSLQNAPGQHRTLPAAASRLSPDKNVERPVPPANHF
jgi:hypothetical protein